MDEIADRLVLVNGRILTFDSRRPVVSALAVAGGRITATGGRGEVERRRDRAARVIDLRGATVIPGLVDAHAHLDREGLKLIYPSLARCRSIADIQRLVRGLAARRKAGEWIVTMPIGTPPFYQDAPGGLAEKRWPTRAELDVAAPDHPVYIRGIWGYWNRPPVHSVANSRALARAGVTRDTVPPPGVEIAKDAAGEPTGLFVEHNLIQTLEFTLMREAPRFTAADRLRALPSRSATTRPAGSPRSTRATASRPRCSPPTGRATRGGSCGSAARWRSARRGTRRRPAARSRSSPRGPAGVASATTASG